MHLVAIAVASIGNNNLDSLLILQQQTCTWTEETLEALECAKTLESRQDGRCLGSPPQRRPHKLRECVPITILLRERLKYALTKKETVQICMERCVKIDSKIRTDQNYPVGIMDVVELDKSGDRFRLMMDTKGRFVLHRINKEEAAFKLCRVQKVLVTQKKIPVAISHDGRTLRYPDPNLKANDTVKFEIATGKMSDILKFELGALVLITRGHNAGRVGNVTHIEHHMNSFDIVTVVDAKGHKFATRLNNVFVIGSGDKPLVTLPKGRGIKQSIIEEREIAVAAGRI